jgi:hypothetical protein
MQKILSLLRKGVASIFNMAMVEYVTRPLDNFIITVAAFFIYSFGMDLTVGRCIGMMIAGTHWIGNPSWKQKLIYSTSYASCFALLFVSPFVACVVASTQITSVVLTGKTTHGLLANMASAPLKNT